MSYGNDYYAWLCQELADTYMDNVEMLREWLIKRAEYLDAELGRYDN